MHQIDPGMKAHGRSRMPCDLSSHGDEPLPRNGGQHAAPEHMKIMVDCAQILRGCDRLHGAQSPPTISISAASVPRSLACAASGGPGRPWRIAWQRAGSAPIPPIGWRHYQGLRGRSPARAAICISTAHAAIHMANSSAANLVRRLVVRLLPKITKHTPSAISLGTKLSVLFANRRRRLDDARLSARRSSSARRSTTQIRPATASILPVSSSRIEPGIHRGAASDDGRGPRGARPAAHPIADAGGASVHEPARSAAKNRDDTERFRSPDFVRSAPRAPLAIVRCDRPLESPAAASPKRSSEGG